MQPLQKSILKVVAYFDMFNYPVTLEEIQLFLDQPFKEDDLVMELQRLEDYCIVYRMNIFYSLKQDYALVERRITGNRSAEKKLKLASKIARFISWFPFIRGVAVSGSLSKNFAYEGCDIDFFIITAPDRLWVARMFFVCFHKLATLAGMKNWFCLNYFVDPMALEIPEKNIYTAIEIATLMPKQGRGSFGEFNAANKWVNKYLPNHVAPNEYVAEEKGPGIKRIAEWMLNNKIGDRLENFLIQFYKKRWRKLLDEHKLAETGFRFGSYIVGKHVCKPIPHYFQGKILGRFEAKMKELDTIYYPQQQVAV